MDERKLTEYYSEIANKLDEMIPCEWKRIVLFAEEVGNAGFATFYFYTEDGNVHHWGNIPDEYNTNRMMITKAKYELIQINRRFWLEFKNSDEETWYTYTFDIDSDWKIKIKFGYENNEEISTLEKQIRWAYDELGILPKSKSEKIFLKEYLEEQGKELPEELKEI